MDQGSGFGLPPAPPLLPKGIGDILTAAFTLYKQHWQGLVKIVAIVAVPLTFLQFLLVDIAFRTGGFGQAAVGGAIAGLFTVVIYSAFAGAITRAAAGSVVGMPISVEESYRYGMARLGPIIWVAVLTGLAVFAGFFVFFVGAIIAAIKLAVGVPVLVVEGKRGAAALSRSWELTTGHFWHVLGTVIVAGLISSIVGQVLQAPFSGAGWFGLAIGASIAQIVTAPFTAIVSILVYLDVRARKESLSSDGLRAELSRSA
ncbi:MAG: hypothetical protein HY240_04610 [Actinobacteria bacterium]|nr:hypothetical protein [Actinomycetota bacterium]